MPARNTEREYAPQSYYHLYNRGVEKRKIFLDEDDYVMFLGLLKKYLSKENPTDKYGRLSGTYYGKLELLAYCLMPNHFHLLMYVEDEAKDITELMRRVCTSYTMYFNKKYTRVGHLFQGRFKASKISDESYLLHISRYIHMNPKDYKSWKFSSLPYYLDGWNAEWVKPAKIQQLFSTTDEYHGFLKDYEGEREALSELKYELADLGDS